MKVRLLHEEKSRKGLVDVIQNFERNRGAKIPEMIRIPTLFVDFPLIKSGIRTLINGDKGRYSVVSNVWSIVKNPLSINAFKLLSLLLFLSSIERNEYKVKDIMSITGISPEVASQYFDKYMEEISGLRYSLIFPTEKEVPEVLKKYVLKGKRIEIHIRSFLELTVDVIERIPGRARFTTVKFTNTAISLFNFNQINYVTLSTFVLKRIRTVEELMMYLLTAKPQKAHGTDYLIIYLLNCTRRFLREEVPENILKAPKEEYNEGLELKTSYLTLAELEEELRKIY